SPLRARSLDRRGRPRLGEDDGLGPERELFVRAAAPRPGACRGPRAHGAAHASLRDAWTLDRRGHRSANASAERHAPALLDLPDPRDPPVLPALPDLPDPRVLPDLPDPPDLPNLCDPSDPPDLLDLFPVLVQRACPEPLDRRAFCSRLPPRRDGRRPRLEQLGR